MKNLKKPTRRDKARKSADAGLSAINPIARKPAHWSESYGYHSFKPTDSQRELVKKIEENTLTFVSAPAGTGKSATVLWHFAKEYIKDNTKKLIIIRTPVEAGGDRLGALPDGYDAKIEPHFDSTRKLLEQMLSRGKVENDLNHRIFFKVPNFCLGSTFDNTLLLFEETQQLQPQILKMLLERIGIDTKCAIVGDPTQLYTNSDNKRNALKDAIPRFFDADMNPRFDSVAYHTFGVKDVMRSDIVKTVITAYTGLI